jgi:hypothetical protein
VTAADERGLLLDFGRDGACRKSSGMSFQLSMDLGTGVVAASVRGGAEDDFGGGGGRFTAGGATEGAGAIFSVCLSAVGFFSQPVRDDCIVLGQVFGAVEGQCFGAIRCWPGLVGISVGSVKAGDYAVSCALSRLYRQRRGCIPRRSNVAMSFWCLDDAHADRFLAVPSAPSPAKRELRLLQQPHHRAEPPTTRRPPTSPWAQENRNPPRRSRSMSSHRTSMCSAPMAAMRPDNTPRRS